MVLGVANVTVQSQSHPVPERTAHMFKQSAIVILLATGACANAALIYSNFAPANGYNTQVGHIILQDPDIYFPQGDRFTAGATGLTVTLDIAMGNVSGNTMVSMGLFFDVGGTIFGQLGSLVSVTTQPGSFTSQTGYQSVDVSTAGWNVTSGTTYWLVAFPSPNSNHGWNFNSIGATGIHYAGGNYNTSNTQGVFRLSTVPEPATVIALIIGVAALARRIKVI